MSVAIKMTGDERDLVKAQERVEKGAAGITAEYKRLSKESLETQRYAKKAWEESLPPLVKYQQQMERLKAEYNANQITAEQYKAAVAKVEAQHVALGATGSKGLKAIGTELVSLLGPVASIGGAITGIASSVNTWVENTREVARTTRETMKDMVAFAAMQEPGVGRGRAMRVLEASRGAATFGEAFDIAQGMQSAMGSFEKGLAATKDIFAAVRVGITADLAREVATQAIAQQQDPGQWLRGIYAAGEVSLRDPKMIAPAAPAFQAFQDKTFAMAVASQLAGTFGPELMAYTRQAGYGLSGVTPAKEWFQQQGLGPTATEQQRLAMLAEKSMDTIEELESIGFTEIRQAGAVQNLVTAYADVLKYRRAIEAAIAQGGVLEQKRAGIETEFPEARLSRLAAEQESRFREARSFDGGALRQQAYERALVASLAARGIQQGIFGRNIYDAEGNLNPWVFSATRAAEWLSGGRMDGSRPMAESVREADAQLDALQSIQRNTVPKAPPAIVPTPEQ